MFMFFKTSQIGHIGLLIPSPVHLAHEIDVQSIFLFSTVETLKIRGIQVSPTDMVSAHRYIQLNEKR